MNMKRWERFLARHKNQVLFYGIVLLVGIILGSLFFNLVKFIITLLIFVAANSFLRFYRRVLTGLPIELELTMIATVLNTLAYGIWAGIITGLVVSLSSEFINQYFSAFSIVNIIAYAVLVPIFSLFISSADVVSGGFMIVVIVNIILYLVFMLALGYDAFKNTAYAITDILFNYFLFSYLAVPLLHLMV